MSTLALVIETLVDRAELERIVRVWQQRLRLQHWRITIDFDTEIESEARVKAWDVYDYATLQFGKTCTDWSRELANCNVAHELLHLVMRDHDAAVDLAEKVMPKSVYALFEANVENHAEALIDRLASILVDLVGVA